jgi:hypothetical protein
MQQLFGNIEELKSTVLAATPGNETRRKWGGMFKQALAKVESHFEGTLEVGRVLPTGLDGGMCQVGPVLVDHAIETDITEIIHDLSDEEHVRQLVERLEAAECKNLIAQHELLQVTRPLQLHSDELSSQVHRLERGLAAEIDLYVTP